MAKRAKGRPCKICELKKKNVPAFEEITAQIEKNEQGMMSKFLRDFNKRYKIDINLVNIGRHKTHLDTNTVELTAQDIRENSPKNPAKPHINSVKFENQLLSFPDLKPKYEKFLLIYRSKGWRNKQDSFREAGFKDATGVTEVMKRPEVQAAYYEMRAIDLINIRVTGNQILTRIADIDLAGELRGKMYDENGDLITDINKWPAQLRGALSSVKKKATLVKTQDKNSEDIEYNIEYEYKFESQLAARKELRKHFMEIELYKNGAEKSYVNIKTAEILTQREHENLTLTQTMRLFEIAGVPFPDSIKLEIKDYDWELEKRIRNAEEQAKKALSLAGK